MFGFKKKLEMPSATEALPGRPTAIPTARDQASRDARKSRVSYPHGPP